jgi:hypothetical protein
VLSATSLVRCALPAEEEEVDDDNDDDRDDYVGHRALVQDRAPPVSSWNRRSIVGPGASSHDASDGEESFQERGLGMFPALAPCLGGSATVWVFQLQACPPGESSNPG